MLDKFRALPKYIRMVISYGLAMGFAHVTILYILVLTPVGSIPYTYYVRFLLIFLEVWLLIRLLKEGRNAQKKYFDQVTLGTVMFGISGILLSAGFYVLTEVLRPSMLENQRNLTIAAIRNSEKLDEEKKKEYVEIYERELRQPYYSVSQFTGTTSNGFLFAIILAIFIRYKEPKKLVESVKQETQKQ
jgi:drug/metabolite transporter (DMT)-like permease